MICFSLLTTTTACENMNLFGKNVEGYDELHDTVSPEDQARLSVFDAAAAYEPVQIVFEQLLLNPNMPESGRAAIKAADAEVVNAIKEYRALIQVTDPNADALTLRLTILIQALNRAQILLIQAQAQGWGK